MWIASKHGFYSIKKNGDGDYYVRRKKIIHLIMKWLGIG